MNLVHIIFNCLTKTTKTMEDFYAKLGEKLVLSRKHLKNNNCTAAISTFS